MKLIYRILYRLSFALAIVLILWGAFFYLTVIDEVNDEVDDALEDYSESIITKALAGHPLPTHSDGTNNSFFLREVSAQYAQQTPHIRYNDEEIFITAKGEKESARVLKTIFKNQQRKFFELTVSTPSIEKEDLQKAILNWIIILYFLLLVLILIINIWVLQASLKPLYILLKWLDNYTVGEECSLPVLKTDITEFKKLYEAACRSINRNQSIFEQQKQFIGNASHELQTPLAICQNRLEMLTENEELTEGQLVEISKIQQTLTYLIRLNKSLLFLSKIENGQFRDNQLICMNDLLNRQIEDYQEVYSYKDINLKIENNGQLKVYISETLAIALVTNLLKNAYVHNIRHGEIQISIYPNRLIFSNTGESQSLDQQKIFQRFYQGQNVSQNSSGLGLAIVEAICKHYQIQLHYYFSDKHNFELIIPASTLKNKV